MKEINRLRTIINSDKTSDEAKAEANTKLQNFINKNPSQRTVAGLSLEREGAIPSNQLQADKSQEHKNKKQNL